MRSPSAMMREMTEALHETAAGDARGIILAGNGTGPSRLGTTFTRSPGTI